VCALCGAEGWSRLFYVVVGLGAGVVGHVKFALALPLTPVMQAPKSHGWPGRQAGLGLVSQYCEYSQ
jgi:hypothetical protein